MNLFQPVENGCLDHTFHRDDFSKVGSRIKQGTDLPSSIDSREVASINNFICTGRTIKAALKPIHKLVKTRRFMLLTMVR